METLTPQPHSVYTNRYGNVSHHYRVLAIIQLEQRVNAYTYEWVDGVQFEDVATARVYVTTVRRFLSTFDCVHNGDLAKSAKSV